MMTARCHGPSSQCWSQKTLLVHAAVVRSAWPGREAAQAPCAHRGPDLLEWAPVVRRPPVAGEPAAVGRLEGEVHLQAAVVGAVRIGPASLVAVDAGPSLQLGRVVGSPPGCMLTAAPQASEVREPRERAGRRSARGARPRRAAVDHGQPAPRPCTGLTDLTRPVSHRSCSPLVRALAGVRASGGRRCRCWIRAGRGPCCTEAHGGSPSGQACKREQEPAGEYGAPQYVPLPRSIASRKPSGREVALRACTTRRGLCDRSRDGSYRRHVCAL